MKLFQTERAVVDLRAKRGGGGWVAYFLFQKFEPKKGPHFGAILRHLSLADNSLSFSEGTPGADTY